MSKHKELFQDILRKTRAAPLATGNEGTEQPTSPNNIPDNTYLISGRGRILPARTTTIYKTASVGPSEGLAEPRGTGTLSGSADDGSEGLGLGLLAAFGGSD